MAVGSVFSTSDSQENSKSWCRILWPLQNACRWRACGLFFQGERGIMTVLAGILWPLFNCSSFSFLRKVPFLSKQTLCIWKSLLFPEKSVGLGPLPKETALPQMILVRAYTELGLTRRGCWGVIGSPISRVQFNIMPCNQCCLSLRGDVPWRVWKCYSSAGAFLTAKLSENTEKLFSICPQGRIQESILTSILFMKRALLTFPNESCKFKTRAWNKKIQICVHQIMAHLFYQVAMLELNTFLSLFGWSSIDFLRI